MLIRPEAPADHTAIFDLTQAAFAGAEHASGTEGQIIDRLRAAGLLTLSLVAEVDGTLAGHVAFSPVVIGDAQGWFGLGPVAVSPDRQGQGIGGALIRDGLQRLRNNGAGGCVVLGDPAYYPRFGFAADPTIRFEGVAPAYFMAQHFTGPRPAGAVRYADAFY